MRSEERKVLKTGCSGRERWQKQEDREEKRGRESKK
jgi:hypothetical protein